MSFSKLQFPDDNIYLVTVTKNIVMMTKKWERRQKIFVISTDTNLVCIGTMRDCQCHRYLLLWQSNFFACRLNKSLICLVRVPSPLLKTTTTILFTPLNEHFFRCVSNISPKIWIFFSSSNSRIWKGLIIPEQIGSIQWAAVITAKNHKRQRRKRQSVTAKREKSQTPKFVSVWLGQVMLS